MKSIYCNRCGIQHDYIHRDCAMLEWGKIEYIEDRDLRIIVRPSKAELDDIADELYDRPAKVVICSDCVSEHTFEVTDELFILIAAEHGVDPDDVFDDPDGYGIPHPLILPTMWRIDFEPDTCSGCDHLFSDKDVITVVTSVDILDGEIYEQKRKEGRPNHTFLCPSCGGMFDQKYFG